MSPQRTMPAKRKKIAKNTKVRPLSRWCYKFNILNLVLHSTFWIIFPQWFCFIFFIISNNIYINDNSLAKVNIPRCWEIIVLKLNTIIRILRYFSSSLKRIVKFVKIKFDLNFNIKLFVIGNFVWLWSGYVPIVVYHCIAYGKYR